MLPTLETTLRTQKANIETELFNLVALKEELNSVHA